MASGELHFERVVLITVVVSVLSIFIRLKSRPLIRLGGGPNESGINTKLELDTILIADIFAKCLFYVLVNG